MGQNNIGRMYIGHGCIGHNYTGRTYVERSTPVRRRHTYEQLYEHCYYATLIPKPSVLGPLRIFSFRKLDKAITKRVCCGQDFPAMCHMSTIVCNACLGRSTLLQRKDKHGHNYMGHNTFIYTTTVQGITISAINT